MSKTLINFEELDAAVKASYQLGSLDGKDQCQAEMNQLRISTNQMLTVNKELFKLQQRADKHVIIGFSLANKIKKLLSGDGNINIRSEISIAIREANAKPKTLERRKDIKE